MTAIHKTENSNAVLHECLLAVKADPNKQDGICFEVIYKRHKLFPDMTGGKIDHLLASLLRRWPGGTGYSYCPVPGSMFSKSKISAARAFVHKPKWKGLYGSRRKALLNWLIQETQP